MVCFLRTAGRSSSLVEKLVDDHQLILILEGWKSWEGHETPKGR